ncbi:hypothetical protein Vretifemale_14887 [Volvox reticuliferus]|uniref:Pyrrolidone-carboxylate peptidase n=1 Tax=Volvox reticuliferus TaxID=1737510 RepID=A0A8J4FS50_9CHLO|nr:hypothetical protein Vretifemale_14887 [Volvox reticuliferus]
MGMAKVEFIVTGFSSFHGVDENPTERLAKWLRTSLQEGRLKQQELEVRDIGVLRVAAKDVDAFFAQLAHQLEQATAQGVGTTCTGTTANEAGEDWITISTLHVDAVLKPQRIVLLHLGVASGATEYRLESRAYNCANFRVADERGWCPVMEEIEPGRGSSLWVGSRLPLQTVCEHLAARGHNVVVSEDAGRFVCNWTYYRACSLAERYGVEAVFVHVPPFEVLGEKEQRAFLIDVMQVIAGCVND